MDEYIEVVTTIEKREDAEKIARTLVEERLAACVQIVGPIMSVYRWQGKIETAEEWQCRAKSRLDIFERIEEAIKSLHPYQVPEIIALSIEGGSADYLAWLEEEISHRF